MLDGRFPQTERRLPPETLSHLLTLERSFMNPQAIAVTDDGPSDAKHVDFDVIMAGGGLSLIYGAYLVQKGLRVAIFDRRRIGCGHREWNISKKELEPLERSGLFSAAEIKKLVLLQYRTGLVRWHGGGNYPVTGVLDCVIDAQALLDQLRSRATGATLYDHHCLKGYAVGAAGVRVDLRDAQDRPVSLFGRLLIDGMGAASPHAKYDLVCPTVGGVLAGLEPGDGPMQVNESVGEILVTTEDIEEERQHIWEGFPAPGGCFTTYLFYYTEPERLPEHPLLSLYERFFATLPRYKSGPAVLQKPTYGFIPAYTRLRHMPAAPRDRVLLVGDAAGRHSPLTFCGFGAMVRSFLPVADGVVARLNSDRLSRRELEAVWREPDSLQVMGGLTLMMVPGRRGAAPAPHAVNRLLDAAFSSLAELGNESYAAFVRDEIGFRDFFSFMRKTAARHPHMYDEVFSQLSKSELARWTWRFLRLGFSQWKNRPLSA